MRLGGLGRVGGCGLAVGAWVGGARRLGLGGRGWWAGLGGDQGWVAAGGFGGWWVAAGGFGGWWVAAGGVGGGGWSGWVVERLAPRGGWRVVRAAACGWVGAQAVGG
nr:hypothetical protein GCM10017745_19820 [Saccharothrix mutabilis subsp. capreolus]